MASFFLEFPVPVIGKQCDVVLTNGDLCPNNAAFTTCRHEESPPDKKGVWLLVNVCQDHLNYHEKGELWLRVERKRLEAEHERRCQNMIQIMERQNEQRSREPIP